MNIYMSDNGEDLIPGDLVLRWVLRSDLAPVPRTVEISLRLKDDLEERLAVGKSLWTGRELLQYEVVKSERKKVGMVQGSDHLGVLEVTALLSSCARVAYRANKAVIKDSARLGEIYRATGATCAIDDDFVVSRFACLAGDVPSFWLAKAMQEEGSCLVLRDGRLRITRLQDLFKQEIVGEIGQTDPAGRIESEFLERHEIPSFFSTADDNSAVRGDFTKTRQIRFITRTDARVLYNMTRVLVTRRRIENQLSEGIAAGDLVRIQGQDFAVITAAHLFEQNEGVTESQSVFWVGDLSA